MRAAGKAKTEEYARAKADYEAQVKRANLIAKALNEHEDKITRCQAAME